MGLFDIFKKKTPKTDVEEKKDTAPVAPATEESVPESSPEANVEEKTDAAPVASATEDSVSEGSVEVTPEVKVEGSQAAVSETETAAVVSPKIEKETAKPAAGTDLTATENSAEIEENSDISEKKQPAVEATVLDDAAEYDAGLKKTRHSFREKLNGFLANFRSVDEDFFEDLEDLLIQADVGYNMALKISDALREEVKLQNAKSKADVAQVIVQKMAEIYTTENPITKQQLNDLDPQNLNVILFVGVNGAGKTTTIGKLAARYQAAGKKVLLAAADTFRAGAIEQLQAWGSKIGVETVAKPAGSDPAAVVYEALQIAQEDYDLLLVDTAGRLQNNTNLMKELEKIKRIITRQVATAPQEVLLVIDATTGQNGLVQAKQFQKATQVTGIVLSKLDGSSQGGIVLAINEELHIPVKLVGLGEKVTDLRDFDPQQYATGLFSELLQTE
ncbi:signal recognition particle-docking protein FtsY [Lactobacillus sp. DCY120]|uniref:Signal recognition particle receptor FtsY n=1 Tax=Bombilactobacillus apium TaxID=2675299 RepID=A0A850R237_9LACO|nr:signal recognition particle-docking protein FtsY [Bombilactobacillus apium]NVY96983.1 signal recognition particle-docking protein FtsY [Bombilactobacillus apium]